MYEKWNTRKIKDLDSKLYIRIQCYIIFIMNIQIALYRAGKNKKPSESILSDGLNKNKLYSYQEIAY